MKSKLLLSLALASSLFISCGEDDSSANGDFDYTTITTNVADNIIAPRYEEFQKATAQLKSDASTFNSTPNEANLTALQNSYKTANIAWQRVSFPGVGYPTTVSDLPKLINTFPTDTTKINELINDQDPNYSSTRFRDAFGFPALDFILYGASKANTVIKFTTAANAQGAKNFLTAAVEQLNNEATKANNYWKNNTNGAVTAFKTNNEVNASSPFNLFFNGFMADVELLKNAQLGLPLGVYNLGTPQPDQAEALYSEIGIELWTEKLAALKKVYLGESEQGVNEVGFDDFLIDQNIKRNGESLHDLILEVFTNIENTVADFDGTFNEEISTNKTAVTQLHSYKKELTAYLKVDMHNALGTTINFDSGDGD